MRASDISNILGKLDADELNRIDNRTREVVRAVEETGKQGEINIKIRIKKNAKNSTIVSVIDTYKAPQIPANERVLYFAFDDLNQATGELSELPPKQEPLFDKNSNVSPIRSKN